MVLKVPETIRIIRYWEKGGKGVWRWGKREIIYLSLHCHQQNDSCIKMGSDESHFNVSLGSDGQSHRTVSTNHNLFEEKGEPKRYRTEVLPLTSLTPYRQAKPAHSLKLCVPITLLARVHRFTPGVMTMALFLGHGCMGNDKLQIVFIFRFVSNLVNSKDSSLLSLFICCVGYTHSERITYAFTRLRCALKGGNFFFFCS